MAQNGGASSAGLPKRVRILAYRAEVGNGELLEAAIWREGNKLSDGEMMESNPVAQRSG